MANPTNPDPNGDGHLIHATNGITDAMAALPMSDPLSTSFPPTGALNGYGDAMYEVWDPLNWMLDGMIDFPHMLGGPGNGLEDVTSDGIV